MEELHDTVQSHVPARKRIRGTSMTDEQRARQRIYNQSYASRRNTRMTEAQLAAQLASNRERARERRVQMTEEQRQAQRAYNRSRQRARRAHMTTTQQAHQREIWRIAAQRRRQQLPQQSEQLHNQNSEVQSPAGPPLQTTAPTSTSNNEPVHSNMTRDTMHIPAEIEDVYRGFDGQLTPTSWHTAAKSIYNYEGIRKVIANVPHNLSGVEQWKFVFREFLKSKRFLIPKSYDMSKIYEQLNKRGFTAKIITRRTANA